MECVDTAQARGGCSVPPQGDDQQLSLQSIQLMKNLQLVVFDMAGTTVADAGQVPAAFTNTLARYGVTLDEAAVRSVRGASKREAIRRLLAQQGTHPAEQMDALVDEAFAAFRNELMKLYEGGTLQAVDGAADTFHWLRQREINVVLNTGFDRTITELILRGLGWDNSVIHGVVTGDDVAQGRPAPYLIFRAMEAAGIFSVGNVMNVGDTVLDLQAGHHAGVGWNVGVLSGAHAREQLAQQPHTHLLTSVAELPALVAG